MIIALFVMLMLGMCVILLPEKVFLWDGFLTVMGIYTAITLVMALVVSSM